MSNFDRPVTPQYTSSNPDHSRILETQPNDRFYIEGPARTNPTLYVYKRKPPLAEQLIVPFDHDPQMALNHAAVLAELIMEETE